MTEYKRIYSIDAMRALSLVLMVFIIDLYTKGIPAWTGNNAPDFNTISFAGWVFPAFLFMIGMTVPFSIGKKISEGSDSFTIVKTIIGRTVSLLLIGVLMINSNRVEPALTGIGSYLWAILMYTGVFLIWNKYNETDNNFFTVSGLRFAGLLLLVALVFKFKSGDLTNHGSLITGWWGLFGLIGWGYLVVALTYLVVRDRIFGTIVTIVVFLALNILSKFGLLNFLNIVNPVIGVILTGNVPLIVLSGLLTSQIIKKHSDSRVPWKILTLVLLGFLGILSGILLRKWNIMGTIQDPPGWILICNGISMLLFVLLYWIIDMGNLVKRDFLNQIGKNSLTSFLLANVLYYLILLSGIPILIYKESAQPLLIIAGSIVWTILIVSLTIFLGRLKIKLRF